MNDTPNNQGIQPTAVPSVDTSYQGAQIPPAAGTPPTGTPNPAVNPVAQAIGTAQPTTPTQPSQPALSPTDVAPRPNDTPHSMRARMFDKLLTATQPSPIPYIDASGNRVLQPVTRGQLGRNVVAAILAGMMTPTKYADGVGGAQRIDADANMAEASQAAGKVRVDFQAAPQKLSDDEQARRMLVTKNNIDQMHQYAALAQQQHQDLQAIADRNNSTILKDATEYDGSQIDPTQKVVLAKNLSFKQVMENPDFQNKMTRNNFIIDGYQDNYDPETKQNTVTPTFSIINPNAKVRLSEQSAKELSRLNPSFDGLYEATNGDLRIPLSMYIQDTHMANSLTAAESFMKRADEALGVKSDIDLVAAAKKDPSVKQAIVNMENALAMGGSTADALERIQKTPNGGILLDAMGLNQDSVTKYIQNTRNDQARQAALAKEGGIGGKSPMDSVKVANLPTLAKELGLTPAQADIATGKLNPNGTTVDEYDKIVTKMQDQANKNREFAAANPATAPTATPAGFTANPSASQMSPADLQKDLQTKGVKIPPQFEALYSAGHNATDLKGFPSNPRKGSNQISESEATSFIRKYINPDYQQSDYPAAASLNKELASTRQGTAGGSLLSAGVASNHLELLDQAADALKNNDTQALNRISNALGVQFGKSSAVTFRAIADQVNAEVGKVVAGGTPHEAELANLRENLNTDQSPEQTKKVIKSYIGLMAGRVNEINERSQQYFQRDVKGISPSVTRVFNKYGFAVGGQQEYTLPNGKQIFFPNKAALDQFKQKAGVQ